MQLLEFERPIADLQTQLDKAREMAEKDGMTQRARDTIEALEGNIRRLSKELYGNLNGWQKVQISRHPMRPYTLDYIENVCTDFVELHGDRNVKDDLAMVGGFAHWDGIPVMVLGQQKGRNTKQRQLRNFGMANPEGYRKALRLMKLAEKFGRPIITLIDTPGAAPGLEAEERGQGEAIAMNLREMALLRVPVICIVIGEGASGGALGIGIGDRVMMLEHTWYSVISPESCSSILWRSWDYKETAAEELELTSEKMLKHGLIDGIIKEPTGGAHRNPEKMYDTMRREVKKLIRQLQAIDTEDRINQRIDKFSTMGVYARE